MKLKVLLYKDPVVKYVNKWLGRLMIINWIKQVDLSQVFKLWWLKTDWMMLDLVILKEVVLLLN